MVCWLDDDMTDLTFCSPYKTFNSLYLNYFSRNSDAECFLKQDKT